MPTGTMRRMFVESSSSSSSSSGSGREAEPATVLCAPRPRRVHAQPCTADLILGPPPFLLNASSASSRKVPTVSRFSTTSWKKIHAFFCFLGLDFLFAWIFVLQESGLLMFQQREGRSKTREEDEEGEESEEEEAGWALFGGSPPARADNPLVHDPHFLLNQSHHAAAAASDFNLAAVFEHHSRTHHRHHRVPTTYSNSNSSSHSFAPSYTHAAPAVRIQGFDVAACRGSHGSNGGGRVLSARA
ncbi:hypothetical protein D1007_23142 [Hordeum vulgare]|nr:hypothetical protein D1007_23142 [Hordeum vulgare]